MSEILILYMVEVFDISLNRTMYFKNTRLGCKTNMLNDLIPLLFILILEWKMSKIKATIPSTKLIHDHTSQFNVCVSQ